MATEAQLRRRIRQLEDEIAHLASERADFGREMSRQMNEHFKRIQAECSREIARQKRETEEEYSRRVRDFQERMLADMRAEYAKLQKQAEKVVHEQELKLRELSECNEELRTLLNEMKAHEELIDVNHKMHAEMLLEQLQENRSVTKEVPHEFFYRGEFDIIDSHAKQVPEEIKMEMYQAAAADASSVTLEFDLLRTKVEQALNEWILAFQDYARTIKTIQARISFLETNEVHTCVGDFKMIPKELDFWSSGTYLSYKSRMEESIRMVEEIERIGVVAYLKTQSGQQRKEIFAKVKEAKKWESELLGITNCIVSERLLSDERWLLAKKISEYLTRIGYEVVEKGFRLADTETASKDWYQKLKLHQRNPMDCYDLVLTIQGRDLLKITFVPVRVNGVAVRNECIISLDAKTMIDRTLTDSVLETNIGRIRKMFPWLHVMGVQVGSSQSQRVAAEERQRKKEPSPAEQIKSLEKKYQ